MADNPFAFDLSKYLPEKDKNKVPQIDLRTYIPPPPSSEELNWRPWAAGAVRGASGLVGGGPWGGVAGAAGEGVAEGIEGRFNPYAVATAGALGLIPFGNSAKLGTSVLKGAALSGVGTAAMQQAEEGLHTPTESDLANIGIGTAFGGGVAGALHGVGNLIGARRGVGEVVPPKEEGPILSTDTGFNGGPGGSGPGGFGVNNTGRTPIVNLPQEAAVQPPPTTRVNTGVPPPPPDSPGGTPTVLSPHETGTNFPMFGSSPVTEARPPFPPRGNINPEGSVPKVTTAASDDTMKMLQDALDKIQSGKGDEKKSILELTQEYFKEVPDAHKEIDDFWKFAEHMGVTDGDELKTHYRDFLESKGPAEDYWNKGEGPDNEPLASKILKFDPDKGIGSPKLGPKGAGNPTNLSKIRAEIQAKLQADADSTGHRHTELNETGGVIGSATPGKDVPIVHPEGIGGYQHHVRGNEYWITHPQIENGKPQGPFKNDDDAFEWVLNDMDKRFPDNFTNAVLGNDKPINEPQKSSITDRLKAALVKQGKTQAEADAAIPEIKPTPTGDEGNTTVIPGVGMKVDIKPIISVLTKLYEGNISKVATKELMQNSLDNVRPMGKDGKVSVLLNENQKFLEVTDNGTGMTPEQLQTVYTTLGMKGKDATQGIGGYGVAKAGFQLGGKNFEIETIAKGDDGVIRKSSFSGTPEDFMDHKINITVEKMPDGTPTGTSVRVHIPKDEYVIDGRDFAKNVGKYSGTEGTLETKYISTANTPDENAKPYQVIPNSEMGQGTHVAKVSDDIADATITIPKSATRGDTGKMDVILTNRGMYQGQYQLDVKGNNLPSEIVVDVGSKVDALHKDYPFTPSRERLQGKFANKLGAMIADKIIRPARDKRKVELTELYDNIPEFGVKKAGTREFTFLDPKGQISDSELKTLEQNPTLNKLSLIFTTSVDHLTQSVAGAFPHWDKYLKRVGYMMSEPGYWGLHLPNPSDGDEGSIFINPFNHWIDPTGAEVHPMQAAADMWHTIVHEIAHAPSMEGYGTTPHEAARFEQQVGQLYGRSSFVGDELKKTILGVFSDDGGKTYSTGVQDLLRFYKDAAGRTGTKTDLLTGEGFKSANTKSGMEGKVESNTGPTGTGTFTQRRYSGSSESPRSNASSKGSSSGSGGPRRSTGINPTDVPTVELGPVRKATKNLFTGARRALSEGRQLQSSMDLSFPFRQGANALTYKEFYQNLGPMIRSFASEQGFKDTMQSIRNHPDFELAKKAKVNFSELDENITKREEDLRGKLMEKYMPGVKQSNQAFTAYGNKLRMDLFSRFAQNAKNAGVDLNDSKNSQALGKLINDMTGRGELPFGLEKVASQLNEVIFSPKLISSRINMFRRAFQDPSFYDNVDPKLSSQLRKEALRGMLGVGGMALMSGGLSSMVFDKPEAADPRSNDFGKLKVGNTRVDMTGGFQQYVRVAAQVASAMANNEGTMEPRNRGETLERFGRNKFAPIASLIADAMAGSDAMGNKFDLDNPKHWGRETVSRIAPLISQDLYELSQEDPKALGWAGPAGVFGAGIQSYGPNSNSTPSVGIPSGPQGRTPRLNLDRYRPSAR